MVKKYYGAYYETMTHYLIQLKPEKKTCQALIFDIHRFLNKNYYRLSISVNTWCLLAAERYLNKELPGNISAFFKR